jgi:lycopene beta-cyclase
MQKFDYIICGSGAAGYSLLYNLLTNDVLQDKNILIIDEVKKNTNDRTWCFWEEEQGSFEKIVFTKWGKIGIGDIDEMSFYPIIPFEYKMIKGVDFYTLIQEFAKKFTNVQFKQEKVEQLYCKNELAYVETASATYVSDYVFNSILFDKEKIKTPNSLLQHFDASTAIFMDFNITQEHGHSFVYVLPSSSTRALVEFTVFSKRVLTEEQYNEALKNYLNHNLKISDYKITHVEMGVIPMTDYVFATHQHNIINIGTAAGWVKASSGFAFSNIQQRTKQIVALLAANKQPILQRSFNDKKFHLYDAVLLEVLTKNKLPAAKIFTSIFKKNPAEKILRFLNNKTTILEDIKIMSSVPTRIFLPIALKKILQNLFSKS